MIRYINQLRKINYKRMLQHFLIEESKVIYTWASSVTMLTIRSVDTKLTTFFNMNSLHSNVFPIIIDILTILSLLIATSYTLYKWVHNIKEDIKNNQENNRE